MSDRQFRDSANEGERPSSINIILPEARGCGIVEDMFPLVFPKAFVRAFPMRILSCVAFSILAAVAVFAAPADEPGQLLKPVVPSANRIRVRIPVIEERLTTMQFKAQIPKKKKDETIDVTVAIETLTGPSYVSSKLWQSWGYEVPKNKIAVLPEMVIPAIQIAPKITKGRDVQVKVPAIRMEIIDPPGGAEKVRGCDIFLTIKELTKSSERTYEPRLHFHDKFLELTVPSGSVKRPGTGDEGPPDPMITPDKELEVFVGPMAIRVQPLFAYAAINGLTQYKTPDGKIEQVNVGVSSTNDWPTGIAMSMGTARGCGVELEQGKDQKGSGLTFDTMMAKGKVRELRLGVLTGPGLKTQKDIVIQDETVWVDKSDSGHIVFIGPKFLSTYFKDSIYTCGTDGIWQLHGRVKTDLLQDTKIRPKK
jgi:hypothetical protein